MNKLNKTTLLILSFAFITFSCEKKATKDTSPGKFSYNGTTYKLEEGHIESYGVLYTGQDYNIDLTLISSEFTIMEDNGEIKSITGQGNGIYVELFSGIESDIETGTYYFDNNKSGSRGSFDYAEVYINYNFDTEEGSVYMISDGTITIESIQPYEISFNLTLSDGSSVNGTYKGALDYYEHQVESEPENSGDYNGETLVFTTGYLENYGISEEAGYGYNLDFSLLSSGFTFSETDGYLDIFGEGDIIWLEMFSGSNYQLDIGTYNYDATYSGIPGTFGSGILLIDYNINTESGTILEITGGTLSVVSNSPIYEINYNLSISNGESISGYYTGTLNYYDYGGN